MKKSIKLASEIISEMEKSGLTYDEMLEQWAEFCLPKVDFSIIEGNDDRIFFANARGGNNFLLKYIYHHKDFYNVSNDVITLEDNNKSFAFNINRNEIFKYNCPGTFDHVKNITEFRFATENEINLLYEKHPELMALKEEENMKEYLDALT